MVGSIRVARRNRELLAALLASAMVLPRSAFAQANTTPAPSAAPSSNPPAASAGPADGEIIVTATKRAENVQRVPISIQALGTATLAAHQVATFDDYAKLLPSVSYQSFGPGQSQLFFRGVTTGGDGARTGPLPTSGLYLDETPVTTIASALDIHIYDIARVEALSGPQGTLYGASSLAGTLRLITNKPSTERFEAGVDFEGDKFGPGDPGGKAEGFMNVPLGEHAAIRLVGFYEHDGGYIDNTPGSRTYQRPHKTGTSVDPVTMIETPIIESFPLTVNNARFVKNDFNDVETYGGRAALKFDLGEHWTVTPGAIFQHQVTGGTFLYDPRAGDLQVHDFTPDHSRDEFYLASLVVQGKLSNWDVTYSGSYTQRVVETTQDYSYFNVAYDSYTDYNFLRDAAGRDLDPTQFVHQHDLYTKQSHELRVNSPAGERARLTAGAFYQRQTDRGNAEYVSPFLSQAVNPFSPPVPGGGPNDVYFTNLFRVDRDYAMFAEAAFDILPHLTLNAGIRGFIADNTLNGFSGTSGGVTLQTGCVAQSALACPNTNKRYQESGETHKVNLSWQATPSKLVYFTYSTGFRPGGTNRDAFALGRFQIIDPYRADRLTNYELGFKTSWLDRTLRVNGALFWEEWNNVQYGEPGLLGIFYTVNAGSARSRGAEADVSWTIQRRLTLSASGSYVDAKLTSNFCNQTTGCDPANGGQLFAPAGTRLPVQPQFKFSSTARYDANIGRYKSFLQATINHQSNTTSYLTTVGEAALGPTRGFNTLDFAVGTAWDKSTLSLFIQNAFDARGTLSKNSACAPAICGSTARLYPTKPQFFGVRIGQRF